MKTTFIILLSLFWQTIYSQENAIIQIQLLENFSNKIIQNIDSVRLVSNKNNYLFLNLKPNEDSLILIDKIIPGTYDLKIISSNYDTILYNIKTHFDRNFKYVSNLTNKKYSNVQNYFYVSISPEIMKNISDSIKYPENAKKKGIQGKVYASFVITTSGAIDSINIIKGVDPMLDNEVIRILNSMGNISPIFINGIATNWRFVLPVRFKL